MAERQGGSEFLLQVDGPAGKGGILFHFVPYAHVLNGAIDGC
jgi:hypothetical protein